MSLYLEVAPTLRCVSSAVSAAFLDEHLVGAARARRSIVDTGSFTFAVRETAWGAWAIAEWMIVRAYPDQGSEAFEEWVVRRVKRRLVGGTRALAVECVPPDVLLDRSGVIHDLDANGRPVFTHGTEPLAPLAILQGYLTGAIPPGRVSPVPTWVTIGTVEPTTPVKLEWREPPTARELIGQVVSRLRAEGARAEYSFDRNGLAGYTINLRERIGASAPTTTLSTTDVLTELEIDGDVEEHATGVVFLGSPDDRGEPTAIGDNEWEVTAIYPPSPGGAIRDPETGRGPSFADGSLVGLAIRRVATGVLYPITHDLVNNPSPGWGQGRTIFSPGFASGLIQVGERVEIRHADGSRIVTLTHPAGIGQYGRKVKRLNRPEVGSLRNFVNNATFASWTGGAPSGVPTGFTANLRSGSLATSTDATPSGLAVRLRADATSSQSVAPLPAGSMSFLADLSLRNVLAVGDRLRIYDYAGGSTYLTPEIVTVTSVATTPSSGSLYTIGITATTLAHSAGWVVRPERIGTYPNPLAVAESTISYTFTAPEAGTYSVAALVWSPAVGAAPTPAYGLRLTSGTTTVFASTLRQWTQLAVVGTPLAAGATLEVTVGYRNRGAAAGDWQADEVAGLVAALGIYRGTQVPDAIRAGGGGNAAFLAAGAHLADYWQPPRAVLTRITDARAIPFTLHSGLVLGGDARVEDGDSTAFVAPLTGRVLTLDVDLRNPLNAPTAEIATRQTLLAKLLATT